jgi:hypothetical protein
MAGCCENGNELPGSVIVRRMFLDQGSQVRTLSHGVSDAELLLTVLKRSAGSTLPESCPEDTLHVLIQTSSTC